MPLSQIYEIFDLLNAVGVKRCILIGGEPTLHPDLPQIYKKGNSQDIRMSLVSNGRKFSDRAFCDRMIDAGLKNKRITISMHASSDKDSKELTGVHSHFSELEKGIQNLVNLNISPYINVTIAKPLLNVLETMMYQVKSWGLDHIAFNQGAPAVSRAGVDASHTLHPTELAAISKRLFDLGNSIGMKTAFLFNVPFCLLPKDTIDEMIKASAVVSGCQVKSKAGMLFNVDGELVTCNHLLDFPVSDYNTIRTLITTNRLDVLWESGKIEDISKAACVYRAPECKTCDYWDLCGGGCPIFWSYYDPFEVIHGYN